MDPLAGDGVNTPDLEVTKTGVKANRSSISDGKQAHSIAKALETASTERNTRDAAIWKKYNNSQPFLPSDLVAAGESWRSNFPTGFLSSIVDRVTPAPIKIIESARYLTSAKLAAKDKDGKERTDASRKSEEFQRIVTKAIRQWSNWKDHNYALFQEDVLIGGAFAVWLDEDEPWPWAAKQNEVHLPEGTGQHASSCQLFSAKKSYLIHEAVDFIKDGREVSEAAGWDVDAMVETINKAAPNNPIKGNDNSTTDVRSYEDTVREGTMGQSYQTGAKVIETYHLLATEPDTGNVTQYILDRNGENKVLFMKENRYEKMEECFRGDTMVVTKGGQFPIKDLSGSSHVVLCGDGEWRSAKFASGGKQELFKITLANGEIIFATENHRWFVGWKMEEKTTLEIAGRNLPIIPSRLRPDKNHPDFIPGVQHGIMFGDGSRVSKNTFRAYLYCEKKPLSIYFDKITSGYKEEVSDPHFLVVRITSPDIDLKEIPDTEFSDAYWYGFFCGLLATDGCVSGQHGTTWLSQSSEEDIRAIASQCYRFGVSIASIRNGASQESSYKPGQPFTILTFVRNSLLVTDLLRERHIRNFNYARSCDRLATVKVLSVEPTGITEEVFCCKEPETSSFVLASGVLTGNCITFFTLQPGNGKFYGSKGLGRILVNMHIAIERARNVMFDQFYLAGLMILKTDAAKAPQVQLKVKHPFILVTSDADFAKDQLQANVEEFLQLDTKITQLAEQAAGAYIPDRISPDTGQDITATEAQINASRENEAKIAFLARAWGQFANEISVIQKRLCKKDSSHPVAKQVYKELEQAGLSDEEIEELANTPAAEVVQDLSTVQNQQIQAVQAKYAGNPSVDQQKLMRYDITSMSTPQIADDLIIPQNDHTIEVEEVRQQLQENEDMSSGASMPVSPRDKHDIHLKVLLSEIQRTAPGIVKAVQSDPKNAQMLDNVSTALVHAQAHIDAMKQGGADPEAIKPFQEAVDMADDMLKKFAQQLSQMPPETSTMPQESSQAPNGPNMPPADQNAPEPIHPEEHMLKIASSITYKDAPPSIQAQIEAAAGFQPASPEERSKSQASDAIAKHPDLPSKLEPVDPSRVIPTTPIDPSRVIPTEPISPERLIPQ